MFDECSPFATLRFPEPRSHSVEICQSLQFAFIKGFGFSVETCLDFCLSMGTETESH